MNRRNTFNASAAGQTLDKILEHEIVLAKTNEEKMILAGYSREQVKIFSAMVYRARRHAGKIASFLQQINVKLMALHQIGIEGHFLAALYKKDRLEVAERIASGEILSYLKNVINQRFALYFKGDMIDKVEEMRKIDLREEQEHRDRMSAIEAEEYAKGKSNPLEVFWDDNGLKDAPPYPFKN